MTAAVLLLVAAMVASPGPLRVRGIQARLDGSPPARIRRPGTTADPFAAASAFDIFAVCLSAGMPVSAAAAATLPSAPPGLRAVLKRAGDMLALGGDPELAWSAQVTDAECVALTRLARRSAASGSALARGVAELAEQSRQDVTHAATAAAERAGVLIAGPLGLCFLPAFVCLGIVPVVAGLAGEIFGTVVL